MIDAPWNRDAANKADCMEESRERDIHIRERAPSANQSYLVAACSSSALARSTTMTSWNAWPPRDAVKRS